MWIKHGADRLCRSAYTSSVIVLFSMLPSLVQATAPSLSISQFPLQLAVPVHPRVLIGIANSESMDGDLSGAIMTGSGSLSAGLGSLQNSSSPVNYTVPSNFTPPLQAADSNGNTPYTVSQSGRLYDNSASRLNVAKQGVLAILNAYMQNTDFALETYNTTSIGVYTTWLYLMSVPGANFTFTNTKTTGSRYVTNPCYGYLNASATVLNNCASLATTYGSNTLNTSQYMQIGASSDDPAINDILYAGGLPGVFLTYNGPSPATPYPPNFSLGSYNNGSVYLSYSSSLPNIGGFATGPTNAGYVPYAPQVLYVQRGFGYYASQYANIGKMVVPITSAGPSPTVSSVSTAIAAFTPYLNPETNSTSTTEIKSLAVQAPMAGLLATANTYFTSLGSGGSCGPQRYFVLISDGLPTEDLAGHLWPPLGSASASAQPNGYGVTASFNNDGTLQSTNDQALTDTINQLIALKAAGIRTFVVGLGAGVDPSVNPSAAATLTAMATAGGTINYYPATSPTALVNALNNILISVQADAMSTTAASVNSTNLQNGAVEYQSSFMSNDVTYQDWTGDLVEIALDPNTGGPTGPDIWSAKAAIDAQSPASRIIATWNPTLNSNAGGGAPFELGSISVAQQASLQAPAGTNPLAYLRGDNAQEKRHGGPFRNRTHVLGDIVNSKPIYVGAPTEPYIVSSLSYLSFALSHITRQPMLYVGANDGMLHAINATTGAEQFAFIPNGIFQNLYNLTLPLYNQSHLFFVDGAPQTGDVQFSDASWHTLVVGGENAGGKSIYALDVTDPTSLNTEAKLASAVLWEFTDTDMGLSYSQPQIAQIGSASSSPLTFSVFFGNGYNSANNKTVLYAVNPENGQTLAKIDLCAAVPGTCNALLPNGLSTVSFGQGNGIQAAPITQVYAGDLQGHLWAIDVSTASPASWSARLLMQAKDAANNPQPITTQPVVTLNPNYPKSPGLFVMFGTGGFLTQSDVTDTQTHSIYGVWDHTNSPQSRATLQAQTLTWVNTAISGLAQNILTASNNTVDWTIYSGWFVDLPTAGQRVMSNPNIVHGAFITTLNTPPSTPCGLASSAFLSLNYQTGGTQGGSPQLDINGDGKLSASDQYNGGNPVGMALQPGYASAAVTIGPNKNNTLTQLITLSGGQQITIINPNVTSRQSAWWQIQ